MKRRCKLYLQIGEFQHALDDAESVIKYEPGNFLGYALKAKALLGLGNTQQAFEVLLLENITLKYGADYIEELSQTLQDK